MKGINDLNTVEHEISQHEHFANLGHRGNSRAWNFREFPDSWGPQLSNGGFRLKTGPLLREWDQFSCWFTALVQVRIIFSSLLNHCLNQALVSQQFSGLFSCLFFSFSFWEPDPAVGIWQHAGDDTIVWRRSPREQGLEWMWYQYHPVMEKMDPLRSETGFEGGGYGRGFQMSVHTPRKTLPSFQCVQRQGLDTPWWNAALQECSAGRIVCNHCDGCVKAFSGRRCLSGQVNCSKCQQPKLLFWRHMRHA